MMRQTKATGRRWLFCYEVVSGCEMLRLTSTDPVSWVEFKFPYYQCPSLERKPSFRAVPQNFPIFIVPPTGGRVNGTFPVGGLRGYFTSVNGLPNCHFQMSISAADVLESENKGADILINRYREAALF